MLLNADYHSFSGLCCIPISNICPDMREQFPLLTSSSGLYSSDDPIVNPAGVNGQEKIGTIELFFPAHISKTAGDGVVNIGQQNTNGMKGPYVSSSNSEANKKIKNAVKTFSKTLDLSGLGLKGLPKEAAPLELTLLVLHMNAYCR